MDYHNVTKIVCHEGTCTIHHQNGKTPLKGFIKLRVSYLKTPVNAVRGATHLEFTRPMQCTVYSEEKWGFGGEYTSHEVYCKAERKR